MKTLRSIAILCLFLGFSINYVNSQKTSGTWDWNVTFEYNTDVLQCLGENVTGTITVEWFNAGPAHHERASGILTGSVSGDEYTLDCEFNSKFIWRNMAISGYTLPILIKREGKLVAVIHESYRGVVLSENYFTGPYIVDSYVYKVECK